MYQLWHPNTERAIRETNSQPVGHRVIIDRISYSGINANPADKCQDPVSKNYYDCIWWDSGINSTKEKYEDFLAPFNASGGKLDYWVLDTETWLSNWAIGSNKNDLSQKERWRAIQNDPRNATLFAELNALGFTGQDLIGTVYNWSKGGDNYLIWNSLMGNKVADYYNEATYDVIKKYYPNVEMLNYGLGYRSQEYQVPDLNGHKQYKYGPGNNVGTDQTQDGLYGRLGQITNRNRLINGFTYNATAFNAFRYEVNRMRSMLLSNQSVPISPWISHKSWNKTLVDDNDYYEEMIIHLSLTNANVIIYWNPKSGDGLLQDKDDELLSNLLNEENQFIGYMNKKPITSNYITYSDDWWTSDYVLSGMNAGGQKVWRFKIGRAHV